MRKLFKSKQLYLQPAEGMKEVIGLIFPNRPQQQPVRSVPMHTKACNPTSFLKLLSHTVILPEQGHFIIIECRTGMRKNYFFARDICHHWAGALIHLLSSNSWGHTCKSHLISFTGVAEQKLCVHTAVVSSPARSIQGMVFTHWKLPISFPHDQKYRQHWHFLTTSKEKAGCWGTCLSSQLLQRWVGAHEPGASACSASFPHHFWHQSDDPWAQVSRLPKEGRTYLDQKHSISVSGSTVQFTQRYVLRLWWFKSMGQLMVDFGWEWTHSNSCALCYRDNAEVKQRPQWARVVRA